MKKIFFIYLILSSVMYAKAQEVVYKPLNTYYYTHWTADTCRDMASFDQMYDVIMQPIRYAHFKRAIVDDKSITVYGVAFCALVDTCICYSNMVINTRYYTNNIEYPIPDSAYLKVQMRRYDNGAMPLVTETIVHPLYSMPRNYLRVPFSHIPDMPIYEAYFPESVTVSDDTIYVGYFIPHPEGPFFYLNYTMNFHTWPISSAYLYLNAQSLSEIDSSMLGDNLVMDTVGGEWKEPNNIVDRMSDMYLFPIIAPQPQGVEENREEVKVLLSPNPASHLAGVSASAVIERLEVYNTAGEKVYESQPGYVLAFLDVSQWPSGVYLLRIHTPQGETTKKLVVR